MDVAYRLEGIQTNDEAELEAEELFAIHPNPASTGVHIESPYAISAFKLLDALGKQVASCKYLLATRKPVLDVASLDPGLYFLEVQIDDQKVIKQLIVE